MQVVIKVTRTGKGLRINIPKIALSRPDLEKCEYMIMECVEDGPMMITPVTTEMLKQVIKRMTMEKRGPPIPPGFEVKNHEGRMIFRKIRKGQSK